LRGSELDIGGQFIRSLERLGLAWDVVRISPGHQQTKRRFAAAANTSLERV
jgi:hypothetical protein